MNPILTFCIPVYNQKSELGICLSKILEYPGDDIEIVISDNASVDNLEEFVNDIGDPRIKYYKNSENIGFNRNILQALKHASSPYAMLLRTRDCIISSEIPTILQTLYSKPTTSYLTGTAVDEIGRIRLSYKKFHYSRGEEALNAHYNLYIHPSGSVYALKKISLEKIEAFLNTVNPIDSDTVIHVILRLWLSQKGDFEILKSPMWVYSNTLTAKKTATNICKNYPQCGPKLMRNLFEQEFRFINYSVPSEYMLHSYILTFQRYLWQCTYGFKLRNENPRFLTHYCCEPINLFISEERKLLVEQTRSLANEIMDRHLLSQWKWAIKWVLLKYRFLHPCKYYVIKIMEKRDLKL